VAVEHRGAAAFVLWARDAFSRAELAAVLAPTSICFDLSIFELFAPWSVGGRAVLVDSVFDLAGPSAADVTLINTVPSTMAALIETAELPASVLTVNLAGETLPQSLVDRILRPGSAVRLLNLYGPTEDSIYSTYAKMAADRPVPPPIGRPMARTIVRVLDRRLNPVPLGASGELYLGGAGTARGYLGRPDLTAERFVPDPAGSGLRLYRTGDLVRHWKDGQLEFLGRLDHQVNLRGFRIEPGEIETLLAGHPALREGVVVVPEQDSERRLVACLVFRDEPLPVSVIREYLQQQLPDYMVPQSYVVLESLPRNSNGKVDRRSLQILASPGAGRAADRYVAPRSILELQLARIWEKLLVVSPVSVTADFFELGGHSLLAMSLMAQVRKQLGRDLPVTALFQAPTVERLAAIVERASTAETRRSPLVGLQMGGPLTPLFLVHAAAGSVLPYLDLARHLGPQQPVYAFESPGLAGGGELPACLEDLASLYLRELRRARPEGPYVLGGWSLGGVVAFEMAQQLRQSGQEVARLLLLDSHVPPAAAPWDAAGLMVAFAWDLVGHSIKSLPIPLERFRALALDDQLQLTLDLARTRGLVPASMGVEELRTLFDVHRQNLTGYLSYQPQPYAGRLTLFRASGDSPEELDGSAAWRDLAILPIEIEDVPGDHYTILAGDNARVLAERLRDSLASCQRAGREIARPAIGMEVGNFTEVP
jgi:thioesterase domain-containing protein/acyl carrier protein